MRSFVMLIAACVRGGAPEIEPDARVGNVGGDVGDGSDGGDDGEDPGPGGDDDTGAPEREDAFLYGDTTLDFTLEMTDEAIAGLATSHDQDVDDVPAIFRWGDESYEVGVKLRGGHGSFQTFDQKPGFALDFDAFVPGQRFYGVEELTLKNMVQDGSMLAEHAAFGLAAARGLPAPRHGYARVTVNGEWFGLYGIVEGVEHVDFVARVFGDGGALYEGKMDDLTVDLVDTYELAVPGGSDADASLRRAVDALDAATPDTFLDTLETLFDADTVLELMALELATGNPDGYVTWTNNYYLHVATPTGRISMVTWGPDQAFRESLDVTGDWVGRLYADCRGSAACSAALDDRLVAVADTMASPAWRAWIEAEAARTEDDCMTDPRSPGGAWECEDERAELFAFLDARSEQVRAGLGR